MLLQLSLEILMSMGVSLAMTAIGLTIYLHAYQSSVNSHIVIAQFANLSDRYYGSLFNYCRCN